MNRNNYHQTHRSEDNTFKDSFQNRCYGRISGLAYKILEFPLVSIAYDYIQSQLYEILGYLK